jgi:hypothetical protein
MSTFDQPTEVTDAEIAFEGDMASLLPEYKTIPEEFRREGHTFCGIVDKWFFSGLPKGTEFVPVDGVDAIKAKRHIRAIMVSFRPKHEHKTAGVAYLLSKWFKEIRVPA